MPGSRMCVRRGEYLYNFWRDAANPRGLWRRTSLDSYRFLNPCTPHRNARSSSNNLNKLAAG